LEYFDQQAEAEIEELRTRRETERITINHKERRMEARAEIVKDQDRLWNAKLTERNGKVTKGTAFGAFVPPCPIAKEELEKEDNELFVLPQLQLVDPGSSARRSRRPFRQPGV
jgi:hypothetical protein